MTNFKNPNLFGPLEIDIWNLFVFWCLAFEISDVLNTRDIVSMDSPLFITVPLSFVRGVKDWDLLLNLEPGTLNPAF
jgi:hypothetical protein